MAELQHVAGLSELSRRLKALPDKIAKKHLRQAVAAGSALIRNEARLLAPIYSGDQKNGHPPPGTLKKSIVHKWIREQSSLTRQTFYVAVRRGKKYRAVQRRRRGQSITVNLDAFYWFFVEFGTAKMAAQPFMRPAFEMRKRQAVDVIAARLKQGLQDEAKQ